jgi:initiation factor 1A
MPVNRKRHRKRSAYIEGKRELPFAEAGQDYAQIEALLGDCRVSIIIASTGCKSIGIIRGSLRKRCWVGKQTVILVSSRDFEPGKYDVLDKFTDIEVRRLIDLKEIPSSFMTDGKASEQDNADIIFGESSEDDDVNVDDI